MEYYTHDADIWCSECASHISDDLDGPYEDQEADVPQHCAGCHEFFENPLTDEGYRYVEEKIVEHITNGRGNFKVLKEWIEFYDITLLSILERK